MAAKKEFAKPMIFSASPKLYEKLNSYCSKKGCTRSWLIAKAVEQYLESGTAEKDAYEASAGNMD